jgi:hypothetical protein
MQVLLAVVLALGKISAGGIHLPLREHISAAGAFRL